MNGWIAVHSTHEAADKIGGIGTVLQGLLPEPAYKRAFPQNLLVGVYPFPAEESVIDDPETRERRGWEIEFDSSWQVRDPHGLTAALMNVAERHGVRLVYGCRRVGPRRVPALIASPEGVFRERVDAFRHRLRAHDGVDLARFDDYPAVTDRVDRRLERLLGGSQPDLPERLVVDGNGRPFPGGAAWAEGRALFPPVAALDAFQGYGRANKYLLELQYHTFAAPALWEATRWVLHDWAPAGDGYEADRVMLFAHDWLGVPLFWAMAAAGDRVGRSVYFAHEARIFRLLAEGALRDREPLLAPVCHPDGYDSALYAHLRWALEQGWGLEEMFPGTVGFPDVFHHVLNREARRFERVVAVGPLVRDETTVLLRPSQVPVALCPNGIPSDRPEPEAVAAARERLAAVIERQAGFRPDVIMTGVMRCELSKAPWRNVGLFRRFAELRPKDKVALVWLSAPRPRPTRAQVQRWAASYRWPLGHRGGEGGDLRPDEVDLWRAIETINESYCGQASILYINQFGWAPDLLGALDPLESVFADLRLGTDVELGLSVYEPFGIAPLEPLASGAVCVLSDSCGCARHLAALDLADLAIVGKFCEHDHEPQEVDAAVLREIEQAAYDGIVAELVERLGLKGREAGRRKLREQRIRRVAEVIDRLSWANAVESYLLPAIS